MTDAALLQRILGSGNLRRFTSLAERQLHGKPIQSYEAMHMIRKGQVRGADKRNITAQNQFITGLFELAI